MVYPRNHLLLSVEGRAWGDAEQWQFGLHFDAAALPTANKDAINTAIETWFSSAAQGFHGSIEYLGYKVAIIAPNGNYPAGHVPLVFTRAAPLGGQGLGNAVPQQSIAVTLKTAIPRGRGHAGRFYPPPQIHAVDTFGQLPASIQSNLVPSHKGFLNSLIPLMGGRLVVASKVAGTLTPVTHVGVGRVIDTQRRRRGRLSEEILLQTITNP